MVKIHKCLLGRKILKTCKIEKVLFDYEWYLLLPLLSCSLFHIEKPIFQSSDLRNILTPLTRLLKTMFSPQNPNQTQNQNPSFLFSLFEVKHSLCLRANVVWTACIDYLTQLYDTFRSANMQFPGLPKGTSNVVAIFYLYMLNSKQPKKNI